MSSYWIRARLTQPLLPDPNQVLPQAETIRLRTAIDQRLELKLMPSYGAPNRSTITIFVMDDSQRVLDGAIVSVTDPNNPNQILINGTMGVDSSGPVPISPAGVQLQSGTTYQFDVSYLGISGRGYAAYQSSTTVATITIVVKIEGLLPDKAYADAKTLDTSKAFFPMGANPAVGSTFYFKQTEILSKSGAVLQIYLAQAATPGTNAVGGSPTHVPHSVNWEYWNGYEWILLLQSQATTSGASGDLTVPEILQFTVPNDIVSTKVNNEDGLWIRVRLVGGGYGLLQTITIPNASPAITVSYVQPTPPVLSGIRFGYSWVNGPYPFEQVFTCNDFQYADYTSNALFPGIRLRLFRQSAM